MASSRLGNDSPSSCAFFARSESDCDICSFCCWPAESLPGKPAAAFWSCCNSFCNLSNASGVAFGLPSCFCIESICFCKSALLVELRPVGERGLFHFAQRRVLGQILRLIFESLC